MKSFVFMLLFLTASLSYGQTYKEYISGSSANFRSAPSLSSNIHQKLSKYTNLKVTDTIFNVRFAAVNYNGTNASLPSH